MASGLQFHGFLGTNITRARGSAAGIIQLFGVGDVLGKLKSMGHNAQKVAGAVMKEEADEVLRLAKDRYVPIDTGALKDSGFTKGPSYPRKGAVEVTVGFGPSLHTRRARGGQSGSEYAVPVHEMPNLLHQHGSWKYLQIPLLIRMAGFERRAGGEIIHRIWRSAKTSAAVGKVWRD